MEGGSVKERTRERERARARERDRERERERKRERGRCESILALGAVLKEAGQEHS